METPTALIYDIEIVRAIPPRPNEGPPLEGIDYCTGWGDHANMGVSVIGCFDTLEERYRVFQHAGDEDGGLEGFFALADERDLLVSFNGVRFDNEVIAAATGMMLNQEKCYDILREAWIGLGLDPDEFNFKTHGGLGLDAFGEANVAMKKTGNGALAPIWWQRGQYARVIDYCLQDVRVTKALWGMILRLGALADPRNRANQIDFRDPAPSEPGIPQ